MGKQLAPERVIVSINGRFGAWREKQIGKNVHGVELRGFRKIRCDRGSVTVKQIVNNLYKAIRGGALVSVAELRVQRELTNVNCISPYPRLRVRATEPSAPERERAVWKDIDNAFSRPVTPHEHTADYVPTQVLAECFRSEGLDGIRYKSSVGDGTNIVFFDLNVAEVVACGLFQVNWMKLTSIEASNPYFVQKPSS